MTNFLIVTSTVYFQTDVNASKSLVITSVREQSRIGMFFATCCGVFLFCGWCCCTEASANHLFSILYRTYYTYAASNENRETFRFEVVCFTVFELQNKLIRIYDMCMYLPHFQRPSRRRATRQNETLRSPCEEKIEVLCQIWVGVFSSLFNHGNVNKEMPITGSIRTL